MNKKNCVKLINDSIKAEGIFDLPCEFMSSADGIHTYIGVKGLYTYEFNIMSSDILRGIETPNYLVNKVGFEFIGYAVYLDSKKVYSCEHSDGRTFYGNYENTSHELLFEYWGSRFLLNGKELNDLGRKKYEDVFAKVVFRLLKCITLSKISIDVELCIKTMRGLAIVCDFKDVEVIKLNIENKFKGWSFQSEDNNQLFMEIVGNEEKEFYKFIDYVTIDWGVNKEQI
jgi:hypothetical protein